MNGSKSYHITSANSVLYSENSTLKLCKNIDKFSVVISDQVVARARVSGAGVTVAHSLHVRGRVLRAQVVALVPVARAAIGRAHISPRGAGEAWTSITFTLTQ